MTSEKKETFSLVIVFFGARRPEPRPDMPQPPAPLGTVLMPSIGAFAEDIIFLTPTQT